VNTGKAGSIVATALAEPTTEAPHAKEQGIVGRSPAQLAWRRFRNDRTGVVALYVSGFFLLSAASAQLICKLMGLDPQQINQNLLDQDQVGAFGGISWAHPFGLEPGLGRDLFSRILYGSQISFTVAFLTTFLTLFLGLVVGMVSGYFGGFVDTAIGRVIDFLMAFPGFFMIIALTEPAVNRLENLGIPRLHGNTARVTALIIFFVFFGWTSFARLIRSQVLSMRERDFVTAAQALGAPSRRIVFKELMPNLWPPVIVFASNALPGYLSAEAAFSYLGIGVQQPASTWGTILADASVYWQTNPTYFWIPGGMLFIVVLSFNLVGDAVRDALDPKADR